MRNVIFNVGSISLCPFSLVAIVLADVFFPWMISSRVLAEDDGKSDADSAAGGRSYDSEIEDARRSFDRHAFQRLAFLESCGWLLERLLAAGGQ